MIRKSILRKSIFILCMAGALAGCHEPQPEQHSVTQNEPQEKIEVVEVKETPPPISEYETTFIDSGLVNVRGLDDQILVDLKYSTTDNFVGVDVYGTLTECYLRPEAAEKLVKAQQLLQETHPGYHLLVFDCCRPRRVQKKMWDSLDVPFKRNYLAPPWEGSVHNYGCAVDLSLADSAGKELDMGTPFDFFGPEAQPQLEVQFLTQGKLTQEQYENRLLLRNTMKQAGFFPIHTEWWHFNALLTQTAKQKYGIIE